MRGNGYTLNILFSNQLSKEKDVKTPSTLKSSIIGLVVVASALAMQPALSNPTNPLFQNPLWWFGTPNPTPPPAMVLGEFNPLADLPAFIRPQFGWFTNFQFEACVLSMSSSTSVVGCDAFGEPITKQATETTGTAGGTNATNAASGGLSTTAIIGGVVAVGAAVAIGASSGGGGSSGTTGTTGTR